MSCEFTFRPIGNDWPHTKKLSGIRSRFRVPYTQTIDLLERELEMLAVRFAVIQIDLQDRHIRLDGKPRADAPQPAFPGVILAFDSKFGPLKYATDAFDKWQDNLRAIALGLEALRKVDRYGITKRGEQYTGWKQLPAGGSVTMTVDVAAEFIAMHSGQTAGFVLRGNENFKTAYRAAAVKLHPDKGGSSDDFNRLQEAKDIVERRRV